jgi:hypothetical protein
LEKELYMAQDAVFQLKRRCEQLDDDNLRLEKALQSKPKELTLGRALASNNEQAELEK